MMAIDAPGRGRGRKSGGVRASQPLIIEIHPGRLARAFWSKGHNLWITASWTLVTDGVVPPSVFLRVVPRESPGEVVWQCQDMLTKSRGVDPARKRQLLEEGASRCGGGEYEHEWYSTPQGQWPEASTGSAHARAGCINAGAMGWGAG